MESTRIASRRGTSAASLPPPLLAALRGGTEPATTVAPPPAAPLLTGAALCARASLAGAMIESDTSTPAVQTTLLHAHDISQAASGDTWRDMLGLPERSISTELSTARDASERMQIIHGMLRVIGFSSVSYIVFNTSGLAPCIWLVQGPVPAHLPESYFRHGEYRADPRLQAACERGTPQVWDHDTLIAQLRTQMPYARAHALLQAASPGAARGAPSFSGFMLGMPVPHSPLRAVASFGSAQHGRGWISESVLGQATILALALHQSLAGGVRALAYPSGTDALSDMQLRILGCLASGLGDKSIALRLHTTTHNVDYHLRLLRKRYGAANRTELAYAAGRLGLV